MVDFQPELNRTEQSNDGHNNKIQMASATLRKASEIVEAVNLVIKAPSLLCCA